MIISDRGSLMTLVAGAFLARDTKFIALAVTDPSAAAARTEMALTVAALIVRTAETWRCPEPVPTKPPAESEVPTPRPRSGPAQSALLPVNLPAGFKLARPSR